MKTKCCDLRYIGDNHDPITEGVCRNCGHCEKCEENKELKQAFDLVVEDLKSAMYCGRTGMRHPNSALENETVKKFIKQG